MTTAMPTERITSPKDAALISWQKSGEEIFERFVQNQIELCHFFGHRWEQYLKLPERLSQCHSQTELQNLQSSFISQFANDYIQETEKLAKPVVNLARRVAALARLADRGRVVRYSNG